MRFTARPITPAAVTFGLFGLLGLFGLAACGDDDDGSTADTSAADTTQPADTTASTEAAAQAPAEGASTVATADTDLGTILVDAEGNTLYLFMPDGQGASTCVDSCADSWPALAGPATAGDGVDGALLATADRPDDGSAQVTYNGWPLYHFAGDAAPGDANGQGVGDIWFVVDASGNAVSN
ncbi:MAG: COG4315 family predicted lipoprotein [Acidimicrobiales bacterium]